MKDYLRAIAGLLGILCTLVQPEACVAQKITSFDLEEVAVFGAQNADEEGAIFQLAGIATDSDMNVYVTDMGDNRIKKYRSSGEPEFDIELTNEAGRPLNALRLIASHKSRLYITDQYQTGIFTLSRNGIKTRHIPCKRPVFDLFIESENRIWVMPLTMNGPGSLICMDSLGNVVNEITFPGKGEAIHSLFSFQRNGYNWVQAYKFNDCICGFTADGETVWQIALDLPVRQSTKRLFGMAVPSRVVYKDIASDEHGYVFVLGGHFSDPKSRTIYILKEDKLAGRMILPESTHCIHIDRENHLYTRGKLGSQLRKFRIIYPENGS